MANFKPINPFGDLPQEAAEPQTDPLSDFIRRVNDAKRAAALEQAKISQMRSLKEAELAQEKSLKEAEFKNRLDEARIRAGASGGRGLITAEEANQAIGDDIFTPGTMVSPGERSLAMGRLNRERPPVGARGQYVAIKDADSFLDQMRSKFNELSAKGKTGPVRGRFHGLMASVTGGQVDPDVAAYQRLKNGLVGRLKSVAGEVGRITDQDVQRMGALIAGLESGNVAAEQAFEDIKNILANGRSNIEDVYPGILKISARQPTGSTEKPKRKDSLGLF